MLFMFDKSFGGTYISKEIFNFKKKKKKKSKRLRNIEMFVQATYLTKKYGKISDLNP